MNISKEAGRRGESAAFASEYETGMTLREYYAGQIMAGFAAAPEAEIDETAKEVAQVAVHWADCLLEALAAPRKAAPDHDPESVV